MNKLFFTFLIVVLVFTGVSARVENFTPADTIVLKKKRSENLRSKIVNQPIIIKTSPTAIFIGGIFPYTAEYRVAAEITTGRKHSEQVSLSYLGKGLLWKLVEQSAGLAKNEVYKVSGWKIMYSHKFYLLKRKKYAPTGFYFGPLISFTDVHIALGLNRFYQNTYYDFKNYNVDIVAGVQVAKSRRISFEAYGGLGYKSNTLYYHATTYRVGQVNTDDAPPWYNTHLNIILGINLGYSF